MFLELRRYDHEPERTQAFFLAKLSTLEDLSRTIEQIRAVAPRAHVSYLHAPETP